VSVKDDAFCLGKMCQQQSILREILISRYEGFTSSKRHRSVSVRWRAPAPGGASKVGRSADALFALAQIKTDKMNWEPYIRWFIVLFSFLIAVCTSRRAPGKTGGKRHIISELGIFPGNGQVSSFRQTVICVS
jgi:hypothetical protein